MKAKNQKVHIKEDRNNLVKRRIYAVLKWVLYSVILCFSYAFMMTPGLFELGDTRPLIVLPMIICVSVFEGELSGGIFAIFAGILWSSGVTMFWGFHPLILYFCAVLCGVVTSIYLQENLPSTMLVAGVAIAIYLGASFFVNYAIWNYGNAGEIFKRNYVPTFFFTWAVTPIYYFMIKGIRMLIQRRSGSLWSE